MMAGFLAQDAALGFIHGAYTRVTWNIVSPLCRFSNHKDESFLLNDDDAGSGHKIRTSTVGLHEDSFPAPKAASMVGAIDEVGNIGHFEYDRNSMSSIAMLPINNPEHAFFSNQALSQGYTDKVSCDPSGAKISFSKLNDQFVQLWQEDCIVGQEQVVVESPSFLSNGYLTHPPESPWSSDHTVRCEDIAESFSDDDGINIVRIVGSSYGNYADGFSCARYKVSIPKEMMSGMPSPPNDFVSPEHVKKFDIEVLMVDLTDPHHVDVSITWLLHNNPEAIALVCKYGPGGLLDVLQLSAHQRCVLIRVPEGKAVVPLVPVRLRAILSELDILKIGADIQKDALSIFRFMGIVTNNCVRISQYLGQKRRKTMHALFQELFHWKFSGGKKISLSNWSVKDVSLEQVKHAVLDAWMSRLVWIGQREFWKIETASFSLSDLPWILLDYFGRSIFSFELSRRDEDALVEVKGVKVEVYQGHICLKQRNFQSRVMGQKSLVELQFKDGRKPQKYVTILREGSRVVLDNADMAPCVQSIKELEEDTALISKVLVDNSNNSDVQKQKLEESLYTLLCIPGACPRHILVALGCLNREFMAIPSRQFSLDEAGIQMCKSRLNPSQSDAWFHMLSTPLSAVIGPPGTGKTTVISAVAKAWIGLAGVEETMLCTAHQNVAVRHMAETLVKDRIPGVLLLISEDYYVGWHEDEYVQAVKDISIISGSQSSSTLQNWMANNGKAPPRILLCTMTLIGTETFHASLMGGRVSSMIIDECSQAAEGSLIPALGSLPHLQMLSVVGDPCQLPPYGPRSARSVFDLLSRSCRVKFLEEQYRMPHHIAQFVSAEFYGGRLRMKPGKVGQDSEEALLWVAVVGTVDANSGTSLSNQAEAEAILEWCRRWKENRGGCCRRGSLVVLTLYEAQRSLVSEMLEEDEMGEEILVYNADSFQGQEADIVLISLVVGNRVSAFAADRRRACVLLSRAKQKLVIFGNFEAIQAYHPGRYDLHDHSSGNIWRSLALYCQCHGWVVRQEEFKALAC